MTQKLCPVAPPAAVDAGRADPFTARFLARVPGDVASSFTTDQLAAVQRAFGMRYAVDHGVDFRRTLSLPWGRYYLVLLGGRDWRREAGRGGLRGLGRLALDTLACAIAATGLALSAWRLTQLLVAVAM